MASKRYEYIKVKGSNPELFLLVWLDSELPSGAFMKIGERAISEAELRAKLNKEGRSEAQINSVIDRARKNEA